MTVDENIERLSRIYHVRYHSRLAGVIADARYGMARLTAYRIRYGFRQPPLSTSSVRARCGMFTASRLRLWPHDVECPIDYEANDGHLCNPGDSDTCGLR